MDVCSSDLIDEITYLGAHSTYHVRTAGDVELEVTLSMRTRAPEETFTWDDTVWLTWSPDSLMVLPE